jgi:hypothetical protein
MQYLGIGRDRNIAAISTPHAIGPSPRKSMSPTIAPSIDGLEAITIFVSASTPIPAFIGQHFIKHS